MMEDERARYFSNRKHGAEQREWARGIRSGLKIRTACSRFTDWLIWYGFAAEQRNASERASSPRQTLQSKIRMPGRHLGQRRQEWLRSSIQSSGEFLQRSQSSAGNGRESSQWIHERRFPFNWILAQHTSLIGRNSVASEDSSKLKLSLQ